MVHHLFSSNTVITLIYRHQPFSSVWRWDGGWKMQGSIEMCGLPQVSPLLRSTGLSHHHSVWAGSPWVPGGNSSEVRRTPDGALRHEGTCITEKWMPVCTSVAAMTLEWVEPDRWQACDNGLWTTKTTLVRKMISIARLSSLWLLLFPRPPVVKSNCQRAATCSQHLSTVPAPKGSKGCSPGPQQEGRNLITWVTSKFCHTSHWAWPENFWALSYSYFRWPCYFPLLGTTTNMNYSKVAPVPWLPNATRPSWEQKTVCWSETITVLPLN